jgi:hypothetical protein
LLLTETGAEGRAKPYWLHFVCNEVRAAMREGVPMQGICLYPILDYRGWDNERLCDVGLFSEADDAGQRRVCPLLAEELSAQQGAFQQMRQSPSEETSHALHGHALYGS